MNKRIYILRIWHAFNPEKLQDIDGKKCNDILPLPNTKELPYIDTLINDSTIMPEIFIYSGKNLSQSQKQQYEDLHKIAESKGGHLYVIDGDEYLAKEMKVQMSDETYNSAKKTIPSVSKNDPLDFYDKVRTKYGNSEMAAGFVDLQRALYLNNLSKIEQLIREKYGYPLKFDAVLYVDFDEDPKKHIDICKSREISVLLPMRTETLKNNLQCLQNYGLKIFNLLQKADLKKECWLMIETEFNAILHPKVWQFSDWSPKFGGMLIEPASNFYDEIENAIYKKCGNDIRLHFPLNYDMSLPDGSCKKFKYSGENDVGAIFAFPREYVGGVLDVLKDFRMGSLSKSKDYTWKKDINVEIKTYLESSQAQQCRIFYNNLQ